MPTLKASPPWLKHGFPSKQITRKVCVATVPYQCDREKGAPAGHQRIIPADAEYLKVNIKPRAGAHTWKTRRLCSACAVAFELATLEGGDDAPN